MEPSSKRQKLENALESKPLKQTRISDMFSKAEATVSQALQNNPDVTEAKITVTKADESVTFSLKRPDLQIEAPSQPQSSTVSNGTMTWGVIYEWVFDKIDDTDHPLFGISYIGQVVRRGLSAQTAFDMRTMDHVTQSNHDDKDLGFHYVLKMFGEKAFSRRILEQTYLPRVKAIEWANDREKHYISERGGILRDMEKRLEQTLNLTSGGQGNPRVVWEGLEARVARAWRKFQTAYQSYYNREGNGLVPVKHIENGYKLGHAVNNIRTGRALIVGHEDRLNWLRDRGWNEAPRDIFWEQFQAAYQSFFDREEHGLVPGKHIEKGYNLGRAVNHIRQRQTYIKDRPDRAKWLADRGWVEDELELKWNQFQKHYLMFYKRKKHGIVPFKHWEGKYHLGSVVNSIRSYRTHVKGNYERLKWLYDNGFEMSVKSSALNKERWKCAWSECGTVS